jgi:hypothetical protein
MGKLKSLLGSTAAFIYFIFPMCFVILFLIIYPLGFMSDVSSIRGSGFAGPNNAASFIGVCGLFIGLSMLIPPFRKMYGVLPWLYSFIKIFFIDFVIVNIGIAILNYGYEVNNSTRHTIFYIMMIVQIIICRIIMCIYFKKKPVKYMEER